MDGYRQNEKTPLMQNVRDRVIYVIRYDYGYERAVYRFLLTFFALFVLYYLLFLSPLAQFPDDGESYHYYLMTKRWPAGECKYNNQCFKDLSKYNKWVIHGLWPEFSNNTWDQFCTKNKFNVSLVSDLRTELVEHWPNLLNNKEVESLWAHEWEKHGTCSPLNQHEYFQSTLAFHKEHDLTQWLWDGGIRPSNTRQYRENELRDALQPHIDVRTVQFNCEHTHKASYLKEIYFCVSFKDAKTLVPCTVHSTCQGTFFYPDITQ